VTADVRKHFRRAVRAGLFLSPGLLDAAFSALAGFATGLYAVHTLEGAELGAYALYFSAFIVASLVPGQLLYTPLSVAVLPAEPEARMGAILPMMRTGLLLAGLSGLVASLAGIPVASQVETSTLVALAVSVGLLILVSPIQDHMRATFHLAQRPYRAALVSVVQLFLVSVSLGTLYVLDVPDAWLPFGSLAFANLGSTLCGLLLISRGPHLHLDLPPTRQLLRSGLMLLPAGLIGQGAVFACSTIVVSLASAGALGTAEAARIVARPVLVLSFGISRALTPRLMEAGRERDRGKALRTSYQYVAAMGLAGVGMLAVAGWSHPLNPFETLAPRAFTADGLTALTISITMLAAFTRLPERLLIGAGRNAEYLGLSIVGAVARIAAVTALAAGLGAYTLAVGALADILVTGVVAWFLAMKLFQRPVPPVDSGSVEVGRA
jgi:O-antigen/teichoic acid export membrane protein